MTVDTGLVHLLRERNGIRSFARFLDGYRAHTPGVPHTLVLLAKGFDGGLPRPYLDALGGLRPRVIFLPDEGLDLGPYRHAVRVTSHEFLCFVNSFTRPLGPNWLALLRGAAEAHDVAGAGATGSFESVATEFSRLRQGLDLPRQAVRWLSLRARQPLVARAFYPFPNWHLRTNAFIARRALLGRLSWPRMQSKRDALLFESGRVSMSRQLLERGYRLLLVGRDGRDYDVPDWPRSGTFRQQGQANLLLADNQTDAYEHADPERRAVLCNRSWGSEATP